jgi:anti-sigma B factor antagonist
MSFQYTIQNQNSSSVLISLEGSLMEKYEATELIEEVEAQIDNGSVNFILDFSRLKFLSSSGFGVLLSILTRSRKKNGDVVLMHVTDKLKSLLTITRLDHVFATAVDHAAAMQLFGNNSTEK